MLNLKEYNFHSWVVFMCVGRNLIIKLSFMSIMLFTKFGQATEYVGKFCNFMKFDDPLGEYGVDEG